jgi:hypothetical protein
MAVSRAGSQASSMGPARNSSGSVRVDPLFPAMPQFKEVVAKRPAR